MNSGRVLGVAGGLLALATICGALGAHVLKGQLSADRLQVYDTAVRYHFFNALGLLGIGLALKSQDTSPLRWSALLIVLGVILFSGSLYCLAFGGPRPVGIITPFGGVALIAGWLIFAAAVWRH